MGSLFLRNLLFTILQPGVVAGLIPYLIAREELQVILNQKFGFIQYVGLAILGIGIIMTLACITEFALRGKGTLSPVDPTKKLVYSGLYKYSRNPMYIGVMLCLAGEVLFIGSLNLLLYAILVFAAFYFYVILREEPRLEKEFGQEYVMYKQKVRRWM